MKAEYEKDRPDPLNMRYGYVVPNGPVDYSCLRENMLSAAKTSVWFWRPFVQISLPARMPCTNRSDFFRHLFTRANRRELCHGRPFYFSPGLLSKSGSLAKFAAIRRASSRVEQLGHRSVVG